jgi:hypothetical protein
VLPPWDVNPGNGHIYFAFLLIRHIFGISETFIYRKKVKPKEDG